MTPVGQTLLDQADGCLGRPPSASPDLPEPLALALAGFRGEGRVRRFVVVAEAESMRQAARTLRAHRARLSRQVLDLEAICGGPLLHRRAAPDVPQRLTELGLLLVEQALANPQAIGDGTVAP